MRNKISMKRFQSCLALLLVMMFSQASTAREVMDFNTGWSFSGTDAFGKHYQQLINLPHSWNGVETWNTNLNRTVGLQYSRGLNRYRKDLDVPVSWLGKRLFIQFEAANTVAELFINGKTVGTHRGGYSAFNFDITDFINFGESNNIEVSVDNTPYDDIMPLIGDFNVYGGLIRPVTLTLAENSMISLAQHGSSGVFIDQALTNGNAEIEIRVHVDHQDDASARLKLVTKIYDATNTLVKSNESDFSVPPQSQSIQRQELHLDNPRLWRGIKDPYLYRVNVSLRQGDRVLDEVDESMGLRTIAIDTEGRLLLNGEVYRLKGVALHEDWPGAGPALSDAQRARDIEIILRMGANAIRLAHYPHGKETLALADRAGLVVWSEIPFVGSPFGPPLGYTDTAAFKDNARQQLIEMIQQRFNHPSVFFWGIQNELQTLSTDEFNPLPLLLDLNKIAKELDPNRLTTSASANRHELDGEFHQITDVQFWNLYFGWYFDKPEDLGPWLDAARNALPHRGIGVSEYGGGGSVTSYQEQLKKPYGHGDRDHPEKWQSYLHQRSWNEIQQRDFLVGTFVWAMFDFSSSLRKEGGHDGLNTKGLVTYDREVEKDVFHFYRANWSDEPMLYIADRRSYGREASSAEVKVFSNAKQVELWNNQQSQGIKSGDTGVFTWADVSIEPGNNLLVARAEHGGQHLEDRAIWYYNDTIGMLSRLMPVFAERWTYVTIALLSLVFLYSWGYRGRLNSAGVIAAKTGFWVLAASTLLYLFALATLQFAGLLFAFN